MSEKKTIVKLKATDGKKHEREFLIEQANKLLKMPKSKWELSDENFTYNGIEIAKKEQATTTTKK